ncbi:unnamed protein product [Bursaphelenchus xylophilus]|uniref:(pine wood nematode) hypothetical protein n=1 Tax=Bursaphelenchus xylophilus TaxID=6326 RepID=A0A1I7S4H7_BURXY|nr:unnamed protein product [Bursaphelenchus xylophilus]CAG9117107.1 unnamed protein product [Bursaphelenchus xylophilus]
MNCLVCDQKGAARHYGSISCSGCKGFFRRSVRYNRKYVCTFENNCKISNEYRNCCRACRFRKCIEIGLDPKMVHSDRSCDTVLRRRAPEDRENRHEDDGNDTSTSVSPPILEKSPVEQLALVYGDEQQLNLWHTTNIIRLHQLFQLHQDNQPLGARNVIGLFDPSSAITVQRYYVLVDRLVNDYHEHDVNHLIGVSPFHNVDLNIPLESALNAEPRRVCQRSKLDWTASYPLPTSCFPRIWSRMFVAYSDWASHIPELKKLSFEDRTQLLVSRMTSVWWHWIVHQTVKHIPTEQHVFLMTGGSYLTLDQESMENSLDKSLCANLRKSCEWLFDEVARPAQDLQITDGEFLLLRLILLFTPSPCLSPEGNVLVREAQKFYRSALSEIVLQSLKSDPLAASTRICSLMSLCTPFEHMAQFETESMTLLVLNGIQGSAGRLPGEYYALRTKSLI